MGEAWLATVDDINNRKESKGEAIDRLSKTVAYLIGENGAKKLRSQCYAEKQIKNTHRFVRFYRVKNKELTQSNMLNNTDKAFLFDVIPYANRESNIITNDRGIPMDAKEICKELRISKPVFYRVIKRLIDCGVVTQEPYENKVFFKLNEEYFDY